MTSIIAEASENLERVRRAAEARLTENGHKEIRATFARMSFKSPGTFFYDDTPLFTLLESQRLDEEPSRTKCKTGHFPGRAEPSN